MENPGKKNKNASSCGTVIIIFFAVVGLIFTYSVYEERIQETKEKEKVLEKEARQKIVDEGRIKNENVISNFAKKYNAVIDWNKYIKLKQVGIEIGKNNVFSIELENALINTGNRPVLFYSYLFDIEKENKVHIVVFNNWVGDFSTKNAWPKYIFRLKCTQEQITRLLNSLDKPDKLFSSKYVVIAKIDKVSRYSDSKAIFKVEGILVDFLK